MATRKSGDAQVESDKAEVQAKVDEEVEQGFQGVKVDPVPNEEYSLASGPNSPSTFEDDKSRASQHSYGKEG